MSAVPEDFMAQPEQQRDRETPHGAPAPADEDEQSAEAFWQWFALIVLLACWLAEASMCS
jgi:hypothetical protein